MFVLSFFIFYIITVTFLFSPLWRRNSTSHFRLHALLHSKASSLFALNDCFSIARYNTLWNGRLKIEHLQREALC